MRVNAAYINNLKDFDKQETHLVNVELKDGIVSGSIDDHELESIELKNLRYDDSLPNIITTFLLVSNSHIFDMEALRILNVEYPEQEIRLDPEKKVELQKISEQELQKIAELGGQLKTNEEK